MIPPNVLHNSDLPFVSVLLQALAKANASNAAERSSVYERARVALKGLEARSSLADQEQTSRQMADLERAIAAIEAAISGELDRSHAHVKTQAPSLSSAPDSDFGLFTEAPTLEDDEPLLQPTSAETNRIVVGLFAVIIAGVVATLAINAQNIHRYLLEQTGQLSLGDPLEQPGSEDALIESRPHLEWRSVDGITTQFGQTDRAADGNTLVISFELPDLVIEFSRRDTPTDDTAGLEVVIRHIGDPIVSIGNPRIRIFQERQTVSHAILTARLGNDRYVLAIDPAQSTALNGQVGDANVIVGGQIEFHDVSINEDTQAVLKIPISDRAMIDALLR